MRIYEVNVKGDEVVFGQGKKIDFKVRAHQLADFCYLIENVFTNKVLRDDLSEVLVTLDTAFLAKGAAGKVVPTVRLAFGEMVGLVSRKRSVMDELLEGWRIDLANVRYDDLATALEGFAAIPKYSYSMPMMTADGEFVANKLGDDYLGTVLQFNAAAEGKGEKPVVAREDLFQDRDVKEESALVSKKAVGSIEDRGTHRVVHFKPEYHHVGCGGNVIDVTVETPMSADDLKQALGREDIPVTMPAKPAGGSSFKL